MLTEDDKDIIRQAVRRALGQDFSGPGRFSLRNLIGAIVREGYGATEATLKSPEGMALIAETIEAEAADRPQRILAVEPAGPRPYDRQWQVATSGAPA
ncbi:hypothetical protein [Ensifer soli]|uniref:hypothetical protein n=1 Tax=Ciceribacter sp. sgz301302 TaxID=3342379 RepID=UPI0035B8F367